MHAGGERVSARPGNPFNTMRKHAKPLWLLCFMKPRLRVDPCSIWISRCLSHAVDKPHILLHLQGMRKSVKPIEFWNVSNDDGALPRRLSAKLIRNANKHIDLFNYLHCLSEWSWDWLVAGLATQMKTAVHWQSHPYPLLWQSGSPVVQRTQVKLLSKDTCII